MKKNSLFAQEWAAIFKSKKVLISICVIALVPLLYSSMFLWAFWDPYEKMNELPVAVVNMDKGADFEGKELHVGDEFIDKIKETKDLKWDFVSQEKAIQGMDDNKYYMTVVVPENFSEKATKVLDEHPTASDLTYIPNESLNFLASQIGKQAVEKMKEELSKNLTKAYAEAMFESIGKVSDGLKQAADGSLQLKDGSIKMKDGIAQVDENLLKINEGTLTLKNGVTQVYNGLGDLNNGASRIKKEGTSVVASGAGQLVDAQKQLSSEGANKIQSGLNDLKSGSTNLSDNLGELEKQLKTSMTDMDKLPAKAKELNDGAHQLYKGTQDLSINSEKLRDGSKKVQSSLSEVIRKHPELEKDVDFMTAMGASQQVTDGLNTLNNSVSNHLLLGAKNISSGTDLLLSKVKDIGKLAQLPTSVQQLYQGSTKLSNGITQATAGQNEFVKNFNTFGQKLNELSAGAKQVDGKMNELIVGSAKLKNGTSQVSSGVGQLTDGTNQLRTEGTEKLDEGAGTLVEGQTELTDKLGEAAHKTGDIKADDSNYNMFAEPVKVTEEKRDPVPNYGTGFAPYFVSLGLFVGALMLTIVFPIKNPVTPPKSAFSWFLSKFSSMLLVGTVQAILVDVILLYGLKIEVQNVGYFFLFTLITSWVFMAILQFLVTALNDAGRFVAILLLIVQLTACAGTFPLELIPTSLQKFNVFIPMTYTVEGYKAVISSGNYSQMWHSALVLGCTIIAFALLTYAVLAIIFKKNYSNLPGNREESVTA
ncbi:YhgE/Pip domain-containing protein [Paenibacillus larvae]